MARRRVRSFARWPMVLALLAGTVLLVDRWAGVVVAPWLSALAQMVFAVSIAAVVVAGFMAFVTWWFFTRHPR